MSAEDIARIETTMENLVELTREQNESIKKLLETLIKVQTLQTVDSKRITKLEADKTWLVRSIFGLILAAVAAAIKVM